MQRTEKETQDTYNGASIEVLKGLEPVRRRPGMYTDTTNPNHLAMEVIDNSVDEAVAGFATTIDVTLHQDGSMEVSDNGRGMPVDLHPEEKVPAIELIFTRLHAGGKFNSSSYSYSGGLHGVGVSVVNALSAHLEATVRRQGSIYHIAYAKGELVTPLETVGSCAKKDTGTTVRFTPDAPYFDTLTFDLRALRHALKAKAVLCRGLVITFTDEHTGQSERWCFDGSLADYLKSQFTKAQLLPEAPFAENLKAEELELEWAVSWVTEAQGESAVAESYVNLIPTVDGGTHVNGLRSGLTLAIREFCELQNLLPRGLKLTPDDVWSHCSYVIAVKMHDPQFAGQTKEKLSSRFVASQVENLIRDRFSLYLSAEVDAGRKIAALIIEAARERESAAKVVERKKSVRGPQLPGKLVDCTSTDPGRGELFIVEGDSAGGSARQARDSSYQAILPLRGKILNTWEVSGQSALGSEEIRAISVAMGLTPDEDNLEGLRYDKICILADADSDGLHIGTLLCALFVKHFPALVRAGHVYVACPPLYRIDCGTKIKEYALDDAELAAKQKVLTRKGYKRENIKIQRFKGLGEMNPEQLRETTLKPESRRLMQLTLPEESHEDTQALLDMLLSKKRAADRRQWLEQNGDKAELLD
ncbi:MAG: DNA topoisomerase IV subunit B [Succinivibrio sp.]|nr:DNA topoisomerase IV subunit B [Succinivibrio sp.]